MQICVGFNIHFMHPLRKKSLGNKIRESVAAGAFVALVDGMKSEDKLDKPPAAFSEDVRDGKTNLKPDAESRPTDHHDVGRRMIY